MLFNSIGLKWIPGHSAMTGNETVDQLAKQAANLHPEGPEPFIGICQNMVCTNICSSADKEHLKL